MATSRRRRVRAPSLLELPPHVFESVCVSLDSGSVHNWRSLVDHLKDYTIMDVRQLNHVEQRNGSATSSLLHDLNSRGWTLVDLAELAKKADVLEVVEILADYCKEHHPDLVLPGSGPSAAENGRGSDTDREWKSAKSCFHRKDYPSSISPPLGAEEEARRRYGAAACATSGGSVGEPLQGGRDSGSGQECTTGPLSDGVRERAIPQPSLQATLLTDGGNVTDSGQSLSQISDMALFSLESLATSDLTEVSYAQLEEACGHFDDVLYREGGHKLGSGGFGEVYHCHLTLAGSAKEVAVKALISKDELFGGTGVSSASLESTERRQFAAEIQALSNLSHAHLLPVLGYSCDGPRLCLVYPFMAHGSLDAHLTDYDNLTPKVRVQVGCDVSSALAYLHSGAGRIIVHRDVKSANILVTGDWRGKLGDFGVARSLPSTQHTSLHTTTVVGTRVYMAHEFSQGTISPAADTYAFGVVLFELLTGYCAQNNIRTSAGEDTDLISFIDDCDDVDELMRDDWRPHKEVWSLLWTLAESCVEHNRRRRPSSSDVHSQLTGTLSVLVSTGSLSADRDSLKNAII